MTKAFMVGIAVLLAASVLWVVLLKLEIYSQTIAMVLSLAPGGAAFAAAYLAPSHKFLLGASMGIPAALLGVATNTLWTLSGDPVDFPGLEGGMVLFVIVLLVATVIASLGAWAGFFLTRNPT